MTVQVPATASVHWPILFNGGTTALALLLIPFVRRRWRNPRSLSSLLLACLLLLSLAAIGSMSGCGSGSGLFGSQSKTYTITVTASATGSNGAILQSSINVPLTIQ